MTDQDVAQRKPAWLWLVPVLVATLAWLAGGSLTPEQRSVGAVFALAVSLWITELIPLAVTALVSACLLVLVAGIGEKAAFAAFGDPIIPLFIGSFLLAKAMEVSGLDRRLAWWTLSRDWASRSPSRLLLTTGVISCVISLFVSNTATTAMLLPVAAGVLAAMKASNTRFATALMLMLTWGSSVAVGVPVGTPPNLIAIGMLEETVGRRIGFVEWMAFGMPLTILMVLAAWAVLKFGDLREKLDTSEARDLARREFSALPRMSDSERNTVICFFVALVLWVAPDLTAAVFHVTSGETPDAVKWMQTHITATVAALIAAAGLFLLPARSTPSGRTLTWGQAASIDWGIIVLFGGGIALGQAMFSSGLAKVLGEAAASMTGAETVWAITALCIASAILLSEMASNTAAATTLVPVAIGLAEGAGVSPIAPALGVALGASFGFMLPVSTPPNAIVYSSGFVTSGQMARRGFMIDAIAFLATLACLRLILPMLGLV